MSTIIDYKTNDLRLTFILFLPDTRNLKLYNKRNSEIVRKIFCLSFVFTLVFHAGQHGAGDDGDDAYPADALDVFLVDEFGEPAGE